MRFEFRGEAISGPAMVFGAMEMRERGDDRIYGFNSHVQHREFGGALIEGTSIERMEISSVFQGSLDDYTGTWTFLVTALDSAGTATYFSSTCDLNPS